MKWLVISYYARMPGACQSEWIDDRITALRDLGEDVTLLSSICSGKYKELPNPRAFSLTPSDLNYECQEIVRRHEDHSALGVIICKALAFLLRPLVWLESTVLKAHGEGRWSWIPIGFLLSLLLAMRHPRDIVFSTGGPASAHVVAIMIGRLLGKQIICELQDPLVGSDIGRNSFSKVGLYWAEKFIIRFADKIVFCTKFASEDAARRSGSLGTKIVCIYPGSWSRKPVSNNNSSEILKFCYLGSLYQTRNLDRIMETFLRLEKNGFDLTKKVQINVYGNMNPDIRARIEKFPLPIIKLHSLVPRENALDIAQKSDVLLLVQNTDDRSTLTIPFKTYDYLQSGALILGLIHKNDELTELLRRYGHLACKADDIDEIEAALIVILSRVAKSITIPDLTPHQAAKEMIDLAQRSKAYDSISFQHRIEG